MISNLPNGSTPGGPLKMSAAQRHAFLAKFKMEQGWLLLTRAEMMAMRQTMEACQKENERLNGELARMMAEKIAKESTPAIPLINLMENGLKANSLTFPILHAPHQEKTVTKPKPETPTA